MIRFRRYDHALLTFREGEENVLRGFYTGLLGLAEVPGNHPGGAVWFSVAGTEIHFAAETPAGGLSRRHLAFEIEDLEEARNRFEHHGVEVSYSTPIGGRERFFVRDPFGNRLEFLSYSGGGPGV